METTVRYGVKHRRFIGQRPARQQLGELRHQETLMSLLFLYSQGTACAKH